MDTHWSVEGCGSVFQCWFGKVYATGKGGLEDRKMNVQERGIETKDRRKVTMRETPASEKGGNTVVLYAHFLPWVGFALSQRGKSTAIPIYENHRSTGVGWPMAWPYGTVYRAKCGALSPRWQCSTVSSAWSKTWLKLLGPHSRGGPVQPAAFS